MMKYCLGRLQRRRQCMPMDFAVADQEADFKLGSLLADRLCLEMQSSSSISTLGDTCSTQGLIKIKSSSSLPTFNIPIHGDQRSHVSHVALSSRPLEILQEKPNYGVPKKLKHASPDPNKQRLGNTTWAKKDDDHHDQKKCKSRKKKKKKGLSPNRSRLKIFGC
ncbi:uncharacterized protein LOC121235984 [Juglans microcarpa x Juglans regia]|uniref:uncharacterized protein LOC121235984 n=1 Tax=Juglans microcarpa x Juglans regia TaxID=2249226 RepID=UPI001B7DDEDB|nr:uncharacterized protein LOC121235984 [Juglans microcarpa x Juglans regia]